MTDLQEFAFHHSIFVSIIQAVKVDNWILWGQNQVKIACERTCPYSVAHQGWNCHFVNLSYFSLLPSCDADVANSNEGWSKKRYCNWQCLRFQQLEETANNTKCQTKYQNMFVIICKQPGTKHKQYFGTKYGFICFCIASNLEQNLVI